VKRKSNGIGFPLVEYSLTPLGQTLIEPIWALRDWSEQYIEDVERARADYDQKGKTPLQEEIMALVQQRANAS
jgi:DNA-binding HxlR family transcriptional regulator